jgi:hypothetical protein
MAVTWYGGSVTSYAEVNGAAVNGVNSNVYTDEALTNRLSDLRDKDGNVTDHVTTASNGHYKFGINGYSGVVYLNFGNGTFADQPRDVGDRLVAVETALSSGTSAAALSGGSSWVASTAYTVGTVFVKSDGSTRAVKTAYTSGATYTSTDDTNSVPLSPAPFTQAAADTRYDARYAPVTLVTGDVVVHVGDVLSDGYDPDPNGFELLSPLTITGLLPEIDDVAVGGATQTMSYRFRPSGSGAGYLAMGLTTVPDSKVSPAAMLALGANALAATTANGSPVVTCSAITTALQGQPVSGTNIPANSFVGTVIASTSFRLSASPTAQVDVTATGAGSITANIAPAVACLAHDRLVNYLINGVDPSSTTFPGAGLKIRMAAGATTYTVPTAPGAPTSFVLASSTSTSATFTWTLGTGSAMTEIWKNKNAGGGWQRVARLFNVTTWVDTDVTNGVSADYRALARVPGAVSAFTSTLSVAPSSVFSLLPQSGSLPAAPDPTFYTVVRGTNTLSTAAQISQSGSDQLLTVVSGGTGSTTTLNDPQDRVILKCVKDSTARRSWGFRALLTPNNANAILEAYLGSDDFGITTATLNYLRVTLQTNGTSVEGKAATYDPTGEGNGTTVGSFQKFTDTAYATNIITGATRVAGGTITGIAMTPGTYYGFKVIADVISGGRQLVTLYFGTAAQYGTDGSGLPSLYTANLTTRFVTARPAGAFILQQLGKQTSPTAPEGFTFKDYHDILPIAA